MLAYKFTDPEQIPGWFWDLIASARGSKARFVEIVKDMPQTDLYRIEAVYGGAVNMLKADRFHTHRSDNSEDAIDDITVWAVGNGRDYFQDIWCERKLLPDYGADEGLMLSGMYDVYQDRFGDLSPDRELP